MSHHHLEKRPINPIERRYLFHQLPIQEAVDIRTFIVVIEQLQALVVILEEEVITAAVVMEYINQVLATIPAEFVELMNTPLDQMGLPGLTHNALRRQVWASTAGDVLRFAQSGRTRRQFLLIRNIGEKSLFAIAKTLLLDFHIHPLELSPSFDIFTLQLIPEAELRRKGFSKERIQQAKTELRDRKNKNCVLVEDWQTL